MASSIPKVRLVRCPKCLQLLKESSDVPMYKCGGCGTILRAKNCTAAAGNFNVGTSSTDHSQNISDCNNGSASLGSQMIPSSSNAPSSDVGHKEEQTKPPNVFSSSSNVEHNHQEKDERESGGNETEAKGSTRPSIQSQFDESIQRRGEYFSNEKVEKPLKSYQRYSESTRPSDKMEETTKFRQTTASEDRVDGEVGNGHGDVLRSPATRSSRASDGGVSCSDDGSSNTIPNKYRLLSRRTFRSPKVLDSVDSKTKEGGKNTLENKSSLKSPNEKHGSAIRGSLDSKRDAQDWEISCSEDFQSVQNWMETEMDESSRSRIDGTSTEFKHLKHDGLELLRKVDELRDQLRGLCDQRAGRKARPHYRGGVRPFGSYYRPRENIPQINHFSQLPLPAQAYCSCLHRLPPHLSCHNVPYMACHYDVCCHPLPAANQRLHMDSNIPSSPYHKAQIHDHNTAKVKVHSKDKKLTAKRHCRPISGAAPFIICYKCFQLLQLPADFLMPRRRSHKLKCGACSEVLVFRCQPSADAVPQTPVEAVHPPSEVDNTADAGARGDPFSYTEEYGLSFSRSYSTDAERAPHAPLNSFEAVDEGNREEASGMALHLLMGYGSAREVLYQPSDDDEGYASFVYQPFEEGHVAYALEGRERSIMFHAQSSDGASSNVMEIFEEDSPLQGLVKKGRKGMNHGLESLKLKAQENGWNVPDP